MIISASRRTDIPAFYSEWFITRLKERQFLIPNPFNPKQVSTIVFSPGQVECIVFWTKNPAPLLGHLEKIDTLGYLYYFQFTVTAYDRKIEKNLPPKEVIIQAFKRLSDRIGPDRVIWRYDPVLMTQTIDNGYHREMFAHMAHTLRGYTYTCITSFIDMYKKCKKNMRSINTITMDKQQKHSLLCHLKETAEDNGMTLRTCAEEGTYDDVGVLPAKCIDDALISRILGEDIAVPKDISQREKCRCVESIDIGAYNTCTHHCLYCYANHSQDVVRKNIDKHDVNGPLLVGRTTGEEKICARKIRSHRVKQRRLC